MAIVTCETQNCPSQGRQVELALTFTDEDGTTKGVDTVQCGACGQEITDISDDERETLA